MRIKQLTFDNLQLIKNGFSTFWILIAVAVVGAAAIVAFGVLDVSKIKKPEAPKVSEDLQIQQLETMSTSDEIADIERDLSATDLDAIDDELSEVDRDLGSL